MLDSHWMYSLIISIYHTVQTGETGDLALKVSLEFQCLAYLQHSEIIEEYNTHNCNLLDPCCYRVRSTTG